ncbi:ParB/RepB/Spo0J family partition protein [Peptoniphilus sp. KCTC 25270]|uniref:ParB/RepB/Spo0J family partition protein n=1 Tax=Peptoniphilus sp. KCTC 25270 TaxID=2897414 RepID=UPI001E44AA12|nr:ParB/RepB/Spo0J family partition protein [Peptoniphilus sp. KCTC 25270]MCD1147828.1 ParB/RepB/Spo0J family partition protein [Peptoniphilus sp. KCTC 25270]
MAKKSALGRGLGNFIKDSTFTEEISEKKQEKNIEMIPIELVIPNKDQPRKVFEEEMLLNLSKSIGEVGILQPILVKKAGEEFEIIAGERRLRAAQMAGLEKVPVLISDFTEEETDNIALIENIQREDLNPIEEALAYEKLKKNYKYTQEDMAKKLGKSRPYIANTMRLLNLEPEVQELLIQGKLNTSQGKLLLMIKDRDKQIKKALHIAQVGETVEQTQSHIKEKPARSPYEEQLMDKIMEKLGTKAQLKGKTKKGKLIIDFYSEEDLTRIVDIILGGDSIDE